MFVPLQYKSATSLKVLLWKTLWWSCLFYCNSRKVGWLKRLKVEQRRCWTVHFCSNYWQCGIWSLGCNKDGSVDTACCDLSQLRHNEAGDHKGSQSSSSSDESFQCTPPAASLTSTNWQWCGVCQVLVCWLQIDRQLSDWCVSVLCLCWWGTFS